MDFSGVVQEVGEGGGEKLPAGFGQGDEVYGQAAVTSGGSGAFAEMAIANADSVAPKPKSLSHTEAAALPLVIMVPVTWWKYAGVREGSNLAPLLFLIAAPFVLAPLTFVMLRQDPKPHAP